MVPWEIEDTANEMLTSCQIQALNLYADRCERLIAIQRHSTAKPPIFHRLLTITLLIGMNLQIR